MATHSENPPPQPPVVLTNSLLHSLEIAQLDASDVLELYYLQRPTSIHHNMIRIQKAVLGIRHQTPKTIHSNQQQQQELELTLEYGPSRVLNSNNDYEESVPKVVDASTRLLYNNQARLFVCKNIDRTLYKSATYLGSLTGTVLQKLLQEMLELLEHKRFRTYQPIQIVVSNTMNEDTTENHDTKLLVKSSSETDYLQAVFTILAELGVELRPVIAPALPHVVLHAESSASVTKVPLDETVVSFYETLYQCLEGIVSGNATFHFPMEAPPPAPPPITTTVSPSSGPPQRRGMLLDSSDNNSTTLLSQNTTLTPTSTPPQHSTTAAQAAQDAQDAADRAKSSNQTDDAVDAAQQAADAAQQAADLTEQHFLQTLRESLQSQDGESVSKTLRYCLELPSLKNNATAYVYWDGEQFWKVPLTPPYLSVSSDAPRLPLPPNYNNHPADFWDWTIALILLCGTLLGLLLLCQHVLGRNFKIIRPLYRYQRWFFHPTHYAFKDINKSMDDDSLRHTNNKNGLGRRYNFGQDVIPLSMGGKVAYDDPLAIHNINNNHHHRNSIPSTNAMVLDPEDDMMLGSVEMTEHPMIGRRSSFHSDASDSFLRDTELVDLPDLKSKSKVAVPVSVMSSSNSL